MKASKLAKMSEDDFDFRGPNGEILRLEDVSSIKAIHINKLENKNDVYFVDLIDVGGINKKNYTCSHNCLNLTITMLFAESDAEDKTILNVSFEAMVALLTVARNMGYDDLAELSFSQEDPDEELIRREPNAILN